MGSFANSIYVRSKSAEAVAKAVQDLMEAEGCQPTDELLDESSIQGLGGNLRGIDVSEPHGGWVCVLDSDLGGLLEFTPSLARHLDTAAITVLVNDSDSWCYFLYEGDGQVDAFDSSGMLEGIDDAFEFGDIDPSELTASISEWQQILESKMPQDIRDIQARSAAGTASPKDVARLQEWLQSDWQNVLSEFTRDNDALVRLTGVSAGQEDSDSDEESPEGEPRGGEALDEHARLLRPYLPRNVTDRQIQQVLEKRAVFAEELLAEFLELLGIGGFGANLSYRYAREYGDEELAQSGWPFPWQFRFRRGGRPAFRIFG